MSTVLYQFWRSSASWRVRWALAIKGVPFESTMVNLAEGEQTGDAHRTRNPIGHVPVLEIDGHRLAESVAILEFLEERFPEPRLYPRDAWARARVRQMVELVNSGVQPLQNLVTLGRHSTEPDEQKRWAAYFNDRGLAALERLIVATHDEFGAGRFAFGDTLTAADLFLVPQVYSARRFGVDVTKFPNVVAAETSALATPHADFARPERQPGAPHAA